MQFLVISHQLIETLYAVVLGAFLGLMYDLLRFVRLLNPYKVIEICLANFFDILFAVFSSCAYCIYIYYMSSGHFRWFTALAVVVGFIIYRSVPSKLFFPILRYLSYCIKRLTYFIFLPLKWVITGACTFVVIIFKRFGYVVLLARTKRYQKQLFYDLKFD